MKEKYSFDGKTAVYTLVGTEFGDISAKAVCHEEDADMISEKTGITIAMYKAHYKFLKLLCRKAKNTYKEMKHLMCILDSSDKYDKKSKEYRLIKRHYIMSKNDLEEVEKAKNEMFFAYKKYIRSKEQFHAAIRNMRNGQN